MWKPAPERLTIETGQVDLWQADLLVPAVALSRYSALLSIDEQERANRFYFPKDRDKFIAGRGILRTLIGRYTGADPAGVDFSYSAFGKPMATAHPELRFNLSHSAGLALFGFTVQAEIGVDLEVVNREIEFTQIAKHFFAEKEREVLGNLPSDQQGPAFFRCWTSKEAFIKAHGQGLSLPLDQFEVEVHPSKPAALKAVNWDAIIPHLWDIRAFIPQENFVGAVVLDRKIERVACYLY